jgi:predicted TPR repeat methyltransferase
VSAFSELSIGDKREEAIMSSNDITIQSYEEGVKEYIAGTAHEVHEVGGSFQAWIHAILGLLSSNARILEIGSAFGRDARYIESFGHMVERTDAAEGFVALLQQMGYSARRFNVLIEDFPAAYDLVFANAVFLHFTPQELQKTLNKIRVGLNDRGILAFSVKKGEGEQWTTVKLGRPRYFCFWTSDKIRSLLKLTGFELVSIFEDEKFLRMITKNFI